MLIYNNLTSAANSSKISPSPSNYWLIIQFELALRLNEETILILIHPSYASDEIKGTSTGVLCPPFLGYAVDSKELYLDTVGDIRALYKTFQLSRDFMCDIRTFLYVLGLSNYKIDHVGDILELKESYREPGKAKIYKIVRYAVSSKSSRDIINLADPLLLNRHHLLPLPDNKPLKFIRTVSQTAYGISMHYRGRPLSSNLCRLLEDDNSRSGIIDRAIRSSGLPIPSANTGFLVKIDLASFGGLSASLLQPSSVFFIEPNNIYEEFVQSLQHLLLSVLMEANIQHYQLLGDGFLACLPLDYFEPDQAINTIHDIFERLCKYSAWVNSKAMIEIGIRCAVLHGTYRYGRINAYQEVPYITGYDAVLVTRIEEGLRELQRQELYDKRECLLAIESKTYSRYRSECTALLRGEHHDVLISSKETSMACIMIAIDGNDYQ